MRKDVVNELIRTNGGEYVNKSEMARRLGCSRGTIYNHLNKENKVGMKKVRKKRETKLKEFENIIKHKVDDYSCTAMAVYKFIEKQGYTGSYSTIRDYVKKHKKDKLNTATIRFETTPGLQAQVDWKENLRMVSKYGEVFDVNIFLCILGYSRYKFLKLTSNKTQNTLFECLTRCFSYFGGIPKEILFDNMKTVVDISRSTYTAVQLNQTFNYFSKDAGFTPIVCRAYRPQTKGKVESVARLVNRIKAYNGEFETFDDLDKIVNEFMIEVNNEVNQGTNERPIDRLRKEKEYLNPLPPMDALISYYHRQKEYKVSKESMVTYKGKKYSVPLFLIGKHVTIEEVDSEIYIYYTTDDSVVQHTISDRYLNYKKEHARDILKSSAFKHKSYEEIDDYIKENLRSMDILLED